MTIGVAAIDKMTSALIHDICWQPTQASQIMLLTATDEHDNSTPEVINRRGAC